MDEVVKLTAGSARDWPRAPAGGGEEGGKDVTATSELALDDPKSPRVIGAKDN